MQLSRGMLCFLLLPLIGITKDDRTAQETFRPFLEHCFGTALPDLDYSTALGCLYMKQYRFYFVLFVNQEARSL